MLASSLCIYSLEHEAQPDVFENAFSGIWWTVSTLLTIGYGDIYPVTTMGKIFGIIIAFLGVGMVAIPTGIISAGFVDQYSRVKRMSEYAREEELHFIEVRLEKMDSWVGKKVGAVSLPKGAVITMIRRGHENVIPRQDTMLYNGDVVIIGSHALKDGKHIELKELVLQKYHPWNGQQVRELDISRQTVLVTIKRDNKLIYPTGDTVLCNGDRIILCTREHIQGAETLSPDETKM
jgi:voltage-gated potassium channel